MSTFAQREPLSLLPQADLAAEIEGLREDLRTERDRHLRTLADFKNYRRRIERDGNKIAEEGNREVFRSLLTIVDDLENALAMDKPRRAGARKRGADHPQEDRCPAGGDTGFAPSILWACRSRLTCTRPWP